MTDKQQRLEDAVQGLVGASGITGAVLVSRDGFCVLNQFTRLPNPETFSAMSATLIGAAEAALSEIGLDRAHRVIVTTGDETMVSMGTTDELLLIALVAADGPLDPALEAIEETARNVAKIITG